MESFEREKIVREIIKRDGGILIEVYPDIGRSLIGKLETSNTNKACSFIEGHLFDGNNNIFY